MWVKTEQKEILWHIIFSCLKKGKTTEQRHQARVVYVCEIYGYETTSVLDTKGLILLFAKNVKNNMESISRMATRTRLRNVDSFFNQLGSINLSRVVRLPHFSCKDKKESSWLKSVTTIRCILCFAQDWRLKLNVTRLRNEATVD